MFLLLLTICFRLSIFQKLTFLVFAFFFARLPPPPPPENPLALSVEAAQDDEQPQAEKCRQQREEQPPTAAGVDPRSSHFRGGRLGGRCHNVFQVAHGRVLVAFYRQRAHQLGFLRDEEHRLLVHFPRRVKFEQLVVQSTFSDVFKQES